MKNSQERGRFPYGKLPKYPHMQPEDVAVWERFIDQNPDFFDRCDYDVPVGQGRNIDENLPVNIQRMGTTLTQKKIDVVAYVDDQVFVIELKPVANARGLGQCIMYRMMYMQEHPDDTDVTVLIICAEVEPEMEQVYAASNVGIITAPVDV